MTTNRVTLRCDASPLILFINLINCALKIFNRSVDFGYFPSELVRIENDASAATAHEVGMIIYPSDTLLRFAATVFAGDFNLSIIKDTSHG